MTHFPHMMAFVLAPQEKDQMFDFEDVNRILNEMADNGILEPMVEPIDEDDCHPLDWAEVTGLTDEVFDELYPYAEG